MEAQLWTYLVKDGPFWLHHFVQSSAKLKRPRAMFVYETIFWNVKHFVTPRLTKVKVVLEYDVFNARSWKFIPDLFERRQKRKSHFYDVDLLDFGRNLEFKFWIFRFSDFLKIFNLFPYFENMKISKKSKKMKISKFKIWIQDFDQNPTNPRHKSAIFRKSSIQLGRVQFFRSVR